MHRPFGPGRRVHTSCHSVVPNPILKLSIQYHVALSVWPPNRTARPNRFDQDFDVIVCVLLRRTPTESNWLDLEFTRRAVAWSDQVNQLEDPNLASVLAARFKDLEPLSGRNNAGGAGRCAIWTGIFGPLKASDAAELATGIPADAQASASARQ